MGTLTIRLTIKFISHFVGNPWQKSSTSLKIFVRSKRDTIFVMVEMLFSLAF